MKSERRKRIITMSILAVAVITLSIGFAAFSSTLTIESQAQVDPDASTFGVVFSSSNTAQETNPIQSDDAGTTKHFYSENNSYKLDSIEDSTCDNYAPYESDIVDGVEQNLLYKYSNVYINYLHSNGVSSANFSNNSWFLENVGCYQETSYGSCTYSDNYEITAPDWVSSTSYWIGWDYGYSCEVFALDNSGNFSAWLSEAGVRPHITISVTELG